MFKFPWDVFPFHMPLLCHEHKFSSVGIAPMFYALLPAILTAGHGAFERWLNPKGRADINGVNVLINRNLGKSPQSFHQMEDMARRCFL